MLLFLDEIMSGVAAKTAAWQTISKSRRALMPFGAVAMREVLDAMQPATICFPRKACVKAISIR